MIISYQKHIDSVITRELALPEGDGHQRLGTELASLDGVTYVHLPDGATLPAEQPPEIVASIQTVTLTQVLAATIANASPHVRMIRAQVQEQIAEQYSMADEIKLLRTAPSPEFEAYNAHAEACRTWGRAKKAEIGL